MILYHYTCGDQLPSIKTTGRILPRRHPLLRRYPRMIWLTDLDVPDKGWTGLTSDYLTCDRTEWRLAFETERGESGIHHWPRIAHVWGIPSPVRAQFERAPALPMHWWLSTEPVSMNRVEVTRA